MSQLHLRAQPTDVAPLVLLPGDPGRARWIARTFLDSAEPYTEHRGLLGFSGHYKGVPVSVQATGMGCPSASIVAEELIRLGATHLLRVGTCGAASERLRPADLVIALSSVPADGTTRQYLGGAPYAPTASYPLVEASVGAARALGLPHHVGMLMTEDAFYASTPEHAGLWAARGVLAFEMEASALFLIAALRGVQAGCLTTVSNAIGDAQMVPEDVLARGIEQMVTVALETFVKIAQAGGQGAEG